MRVVPCEQGSPEWVAARLGVVTASCFDMLLTPKTLKASASAERYLNQLVAEHVLGCQVVNVETEWMERGKELEGEAVSYYEYARGVDAEKVGFILRDDGRVGCSPDRLVGADGGAEIKVPSADVHVGYLRDPRTLVADYRGQIQGCLLVTGREWWDAVSYNPQIPSVVERVYPDPKYVEAVGPVLEEFLARLEEAKAKVAGAVAAREAANAADPIGSW